MSAPASAPNFALVVFNAQNRALLRRENRTLDLTAHGSGVCPDTIDGIGAIRPVEIETLGNGAKLFFALLADDAQPAAQFHATTIEELLGSNPDALSPALANARDAIARHSIRIPYLNHRDNDYIYRFRTEKQRNRSVYQGDARAQALYQSTLCETIKRLRRTKERSSDAPAMLDFGAVRYVLPSHFGFCLGVQNAIERAYESIAENPGRTVFMLSELIHNPFVNEDLLARGLRYLQSDKGEPVKNPATGRFFWDELASDDIVVIPAFGATDADKRRLIERGIALNRYDATCMLVEKVWKAARRYGQLGYTVVIHGKHEHEETKATFSNSAKYAPSLIIRDRGEAETLCKIILAPDAPTARTLFAEKFADRCSSDFDPVRDLSRLAVVNQTTLLRNETLQIIDLIEKALVEKYGRETLADHLYAESRGDTLCYATQVNQDALQRALELPLDAALVVGGKNSSNTFQLFRLCEKRFRERAFYIQSEANILSRSEIDHYIYAYHPGDPREGRHERRAFLPSENPSEPLRLLITGGASCPDGLIQQVIARINGFFPKNALRPTEAVLADLESSEDNKSL